RQKQLSLSLVLLKVHQSNMSFYLFYSQSSDQSYMVRYVFQKQRQADAYPSEKKFCIKQHVKDSRSVHSFTVTHIQLYTSSHPAMKSSQTKQSTFTFPKAQKLVEYKTSPYKLCVYFPLFKKEKKKVDSFVSIKEDWFQLN
ncbi:hypothetical protein TorRG33x02_079050, partial [Trema orientale]